VSEPFCPGYPPPYDALAADYPGPDAYPPDAFRVEWGPIFHRGRLDGTARLLVIGQDPAATEGVTRRILVGVAGQRAQGLLTRLGLTRSYVMVNTFAYSVYGQWGGDHHWNDPAIVTYRHAWLDTLAAHNEFEAVITLGSLADKAYTAWAATQPKQEPVGRHAELLHPTYPEAASASGSTTLAAATKELLDNWNDALPGLHDSLQQVDQAPNPAPYGSTFTAADLTSIPPDDLPAGLPTWMRSIEAWAERTGRNADEKRATITITVPASQRPWTAAHEDRVASLASGRRSARVPHTA
jgi:uracil-DNA glycosylase